MSNNISKVKKILFLLTNLSGGGAEKVLIDILRHTDFTRYEVDLLLVVKEGVYLTSVPNDVKVYSLYENRGLKYKLHFALSRYWGLDYFQRSLVQKKVKGRYDAIVSFMEGIPLKFHKYLLGRTKKNISWVHLDLLKHHYTVKYFRNDEERLLYEKMQQVFFVSNDACQSFKDLFGLVVGPFQTIYNPIDKANIERLSAIRIINKERFTICTVGRLTYQKRYDRLLRLAKRLKDEKREVDFWLLGIGPLEEDLKKTASELGVETIVKFLGFQQNPYPYIKSADLFLSTSMAEGYPLVICEALCLEKPIVATNVTGPREILRDSEYGLLAEEDDESIYKAVCRMLDDKNLRVHYIEKAREKKKDFDIQSVVDKIYKMISPNE